MKENGRKPVNLLLSQIESRVYITIFTEKLMKIMNVVFRTVYIGKFSPIFIIVSREIHRALEAYVFTGLRIRTLVEGRKCA